MGPLAEKETAKSQKPIVLGNPNRFSCLLQKKLLNLTKLRQIVIFNFDELVELGFEQQMLQLLVSAFQQSSEIKANQVDFVDDDSLRVFELDPAFRMKCFELV